MFARRDGVRRGVAVALLLAAAPLASGCSLAFVRGPSSSDADARPDCTRWPVAPILDLAYVGGAAASLAALDRRCSGGRCESAAPAFIGAAAIITAIPVAVSSIIGMKRVYQCNEAHQDWCASHGGCPGDEVRRPDVPGAGEPDGTGARR